jgi:hypothetical protein
MAIENTTTIWNGMTIYNRIDTSTGQVQGYASTAARTAGTAPLFQSPPTGASQSGSEYEIPTAQSAEFLRLYNSRSPNASQLTEAEFQNAFFNTSQGGGVNTANTTRASQLNLQSDTDRLYYFNDLRIPGTIHPTTGQIINASGNASSRQLFGTPPSVLTDGSVPLSVRGVSDAPIAANRAGVDRGGSRILRYPEMSLAGLGYDYIQIASYEYVPSMVGRTLGTQTVGSGNFAGPNRLRAKSPRTTIQLPMQPSLTESNSTSWNQDTMNEIQRIGGAGAEKIITEIGDGNTSGSVGAIAEMFGKLTETVLSGDNKGAFASFFAGQAVGANIMGRTTGQVINPNLELLFEGPTLRTFSFNFPLTPRDETEADICWDIIQTMKKDMAPVKEDPALFLKPPCLWQLDYLYNGDGQHPFMNKFKPCALTSFNVDYTPAGSYMTYDGGSMTAYKIQMTFNEIEPVYRGDYEDGDFQ